uniref:Protein phosphatase 1 regulatory subunit 3B-like isoform X2 n=2 Tax=Hirondellea gigas TaxID=1518452 RepID=A0A6A7FS97_9CRUS
MTACTMPSDYGAELLLGSSPVVGSGFHGTGSSFFPDYSRCSAVGGMWDNTNCTTASPFYSGTLMGRYSDINTTSNECRSFARTGSLRRSKKLNKLKSEFPKPLLLTIPAKSILRTQEELPQHEDETITSPNREKKRVSFADALGQQLERIRLITERPDCPPLWSKEFIEKVTGIPLEPPEKQWELTFTQPVSDYMGYKLKLDTERVALENVIIEEKKGHVRGTVKVCNLSFHKDVLIRYTSNGWMTTEDCPATFIPSPRTSVAYDLYDRFGFEIPLPDIARADKLEFCVRFSCDGTEYWDNNKGRNFTVVSFRSKNNSASKKVVRDANELCLDSWTEFASWNHLTIDESPYW